MEQVSSAGPSIKRAQSGDLCELPKRPKLQIPRFDDPTLISEENQIRRLFEEILDFLKDEHFVEDIEIVDAMERIISSFRYDQGRQFSDIDLKQPESRCGYLQRYAIHGAGLMRHKTLQAFHHCPLLRRGLRRTKLRVVSLGGGPGNDVVGFLSALQELGPNGCHIDIKVVDALEQWSQCVRLVKHFARVGDFGSVSEIFRNNTVDVRFITALLPVDPDPTGDDFMCFAAVENADVILISKLISVLPWDQKKEVIEYVHYVMNESALILLVDAPFHPDLWKDFEVLYLSEEGETYQLYTESNFNPFYSEKFYDRKVISKSRIAVLRKKTKLTFRDVLTELGM